MSFNTALSGLNAAANNLAVTGNNIANANTTGFKESRSQFADVYAGSLGGVSSTTPGSGVRVAEVAQQFGQGNLEFTENSLDLAISGEGFFVLGEDVNNTDSRSYTRAGAFQVNREGYVVNHDDQPLLAYRPNGATVEAGFSRGVLQTLQLDSAQGSPRATQAVDMRLNLDAQAAAPAASTFDPDDPASFNHSTSVTVFDSLGSPYIASSYFVAAPTAANPNQWELYTYLDGKPVASTPALLDFDSQGNLTAPADGKVVYPPFDLSTLNPDTDAAPLALTFDFSGSTQFGSPFSVDELKQDGLTAGRLTGVDIDDTGVVFARFSNGASTPLGQVALAKFPNPQGLSKLGDTAWTQSAASGEPLPGVAQTNHFGSIQAGALEGSNVDLAEQLVKLIIAQQGYQANAEVISTEDSVTQTILNIR